MAFIGILFANIFVFAILGMAFIGIILFIISMILFSKNKKAQKEGTKKKKIGAIVTLVISIILFFPLVFGIFVVSIDSNIQDRKEKRIIESIENKVIVERDEWRNGFVYNDKNLVPINIFINSDNYNINGSFKNLNKVGALVIDGTNTYYNLYEIDNDSGYKIYFVWIKTFVGGDYYSRTFVDKNEYDSVLEYYNNKANLKVSALWKTAPQDTHLSNAWKDLKLNINNNRDEIIELSHEVLDDPNRYKSTTSSTNYDECIDFEIKSDDKVFTLDLNIYIIDDKIKLDLNDYEVADEVIEKHKTMLLFLINNAKKEL